MPATEHETQSRRDRWHNSGLDDLDGCPRMWALTNLTDLPVPAKLNTVAGTAYHAALEAREIERLHGREPLSAATMLTLALDVLDRELETADPQQLADYTGPSRAKNPPRGRDALQIEVDAALTAFHEGDLGEGRTLASELDTLTPVSLESYARARLVPTAREIGGTWDGLYRNVELRPVLIDHKTANSFQYKYGHDGSGVRAQAAHYAVLAALDESVPVDALPEAWFLVALRKKVRPTTERARLLTVQPQLEDVARLRERVLHAEQVRNDGAFPRNPAYKWCGNCPFHAGCEGDEQGALRLPWPQVLTAIGAN